MRTTTQGQWRDLVFGLHTWYPVTSVEGVDDLPAVRGYDTPKPQTDGDWSGIDTLGSRVIKLGLGIVATTGDELESRRMAARAQLTKSAAPEVLRLSDGRCVYAKLRKSAIPSDMGADWSIGDIFLEFYCSDPRVYDPQEQIIELIAGVPRVDGRQYSRGYVGPNPAIPNLAVPGPGWSFPQSSQPVSEGQLTNTGNTPAPVTVTMYGTLLQPVIEIVGHSLLRLIVDLGASDVLQITRDQAIILNGTPRRDLVAPGAVWPEVPPGTWTVRLSTNAGGGRATIAMRSASQ